MSSRLPVLVGTVGGPGRYTRWLVLLAAAASVLIGVMNYVSTRHAQADLARGSNQEVFVVGNKGGGSEGVCPLRVRIPGYPRIVSTEGPCAYPASNTAPAYAWVSPEHRVTFDGPPNGFTGNARAVVSGVLSLLLSGAALGGGLAVLLLIDHWLRWRRWR